MGVSDEKRFSLTKENGIDSNKHTVIESEINI